MRYLSGINHGFFKKNITAKKNELLQPAGFHETHKSSRRMGRCFIQPFSFPYLRTEYFILNAEGYRVIPENLS